MWHAGRKREMYTEFWYRQNEGRELETDKWQAVLNTVMNTHSPFNAVNSCRAEKLIAFPEGPCPRSE